MIEPVSVHLVSGLAGAFCALLVFGPLIYSSRLNFTLLRHHRALVTVTLLAAPLVSS